MSDLPQWIQAAAESTGTATALWLGIRANRQRAAEDWADRLKDLSGHDEDSLREAIESSPVLGELIYTAWDAAARSAAEYKRLILARVVAAAVRGEHDTDVDELPYLVRASAAIEPSEIRLLVLLARPGAVRSEMSKGTLVGALLPKDLRAAMPDAGDLLVPMLASLQSAGLIEDLGGGGYGGGQAWRIAPLGRSLLRYLDPPEAGWLHEADVVAVLNAPDTLLVRNIGVGEARSIRLDADKAPGYAPWDEGPPAEFALAGGAQALFGIRDRKADRNALWLTITWEDGCAEKHRRELGVSPMG